MQSHPPLIKFSNFCWIQHTYAEPKIKVIRRQHLGYSKIQNISTGMTERKVTHATPFDPLLFLWSLIKKSRWLTWGCRLDGWSTPSVLVRDDCSMLEKLTPKSSTITSAASTSTCQCNHTTLQYDIGDTGLVKGAGSSTFKPSVYVCPVEGAWKLYVPTLGDHGKWTILMNK